MRLQRDGDRMVVAEVRHPKGERQPCSFLASVERFEEFHDKPSTGVQHVKGPSKVPDVVFRLGELSAVQYVSDKWDGRRRKYVHYFEGPKPSLCGDAEGRLWILGGRYDIGPAGIEG